MKKNVLITGVNRGIGFYLYHSLQPTYNVKGTSRKIIYPYSFHLDFCDTESFYYNIKHIKHFSPHYLIHNAAIGASGLYNDFTPDQMENLFQTNFFGPLLFFTLFAEKYKKPFHLIVISSIATKKYYPSLGLYSASKVALEKAILDLQLIRKNIKISFLHLPPIKSDEFISPPTILKGERNYCVPLEFVEKEIILEELFKIMRS